MPLEGLEQTPVVENMEFASETFDKLRHDRAIIENKIIELKDKIQGFLTHESGKSLSLDTTVASNEEVKNFADLLDEEARLQEEIATRLRKMLETKL